MENPKQPFVSFMSVILCTNKLFQSPGKRLLNQDKDLLNGAMKKCRNFLEKGGN